MGTTSKHGISTAALAVLLLAGGSAAAANGAMKDVMKKMGAAAAGDEAKPLAPLFSQTLLMKPNDPEYAGWQAIAERGKAAAEANDLAAAKTTCKDCHTQFRDKFKAKYGSKAP